EPGAGGVPANRKAMGYSGGSQWGAGRGAALSPGADQGHECRQTSGYASRRWVYSAERSQFARAGGRQISLQSADPADRGAVDPGDWQREGGGAAGPAHGHGGQRYSGPQTALGPGVAGRLPGD